MLYNCLWIIINKNTLKIGIYTGDSSIKLWYDFFINATIHGLDIYLRDDIISQILKIMIKLNYIEVLMLMISILLIHTYQIKDLMLF